MLPLDYDYINKEAKRCLDEDLSGYPDGFITKDGLVVDKKVQLQIRIRDITHNEIDKLIENTIYSQVGLKQQQLIDSYEEYKTEFKHGELPTQGFFLYRWFNNNNEIIYVGKTTDLRRRMNDHKRDNTKIKEAVRIEYVDVQHLGIQSSDNLEWLEDYFINLYHPKYNKRHNYSTFTVPEIPIYAELQWTDITTKVFTSFSVKPMSWSQYEGYYLQNNPTVITINYSLEEAYSLQGCPDEAELLIDTLADWNIKLEQII